MKYIDKTNKKPIALEPIPGEYLLKFKEGLQGESLVAKISQAERCISMKWVPDNFLAIIKFDEEAERTRSTKDALEDIKKDEKVDDIVSVFRDSEGFSRYVLPNRLLVAYNIDSQRELKNKLSRDFSIIERSRFGNWFIIELPPRSELEKAIEFINNFAEVQYCEPVFYGINDAEAYSSDSLSWNLKDINIHEAWEITSGKPEIVVAVIDGKPDINHPALQASNLKNIPNEWMFSNVQSLSSHSTQILGILAGQGGDVKGIAPNVSFMTIVVRLESQYYGQRAEAIHYLAHILKSGRLNNQPVSRIIANCSWKTSGDIGVIREAIRTAASAGVIFVTSAGNGSHSGPHYPSDYTKTIKGVLSVAALSPGDTKAGYSNYSSAVSISAPGGAGLPFDEDDIYSTDLNDSYSYSAGTSLSAPHTAGTIALMLSANPDMDFEDIKNVLDRTAISIQRENPYKWMLLGSGKLNAGEAVKAVVESPGIPPSQPVPDTGGVVDVAPVDGQPKAPKIKIELQEDSMIYQSDEIKQFIQNVINRVSAEIRQIFERRGYNIATIKITLEADEYITILNLYK